MVSLPPEGLAGANLVFALKFKPVARGFRMAASSWLTRLIAAINAEYDRRVRRASLVTAYAPPHPHDDDDGAVIVNVPRGTAVARPSPTQPSE